MNYQYLANILAKQKHDLGMSEAYIAQQAGVSQPTVHRILSGRHNRAAWNDVAAIAGVLKIQITIQAEDPETILDRRAQAMAETMTRINRASNQLEGQGFSDSAKQKMTRETKAWLRERPKKLWWEE